MAKEKKKVPALRFKGFTNDWEQRKLGEVMDVGSVKRIHQSDWKTEGVRFLRARDIVSFSKNEKPSDLLYIDNSKYNEYSKISGKVQKGDLLVTGVGSIGVPMLIKSDDPIYFKDGNIIWFKNNNSLNGNFFYYSFTSNKIQNFIRKSSGAGTVGTYTIDNGKKTPILIPKNIDEQEKVGKFLSRFDGLIALHQRKLVLLKQLKKGLLQKMFADKNSKQPVLRFKGFHDDWEQRKLGEIGKVFTGNTPLTKNTENWTTDKSIGHVWITPTDINKNIMFDSERYLSDKGWSQARVVPKNSVLITSIASIGKNAINGVEVAFNQQINALVVQKNNPYFILTLMNKEKQRFESLAGQTATPIINKSTFSSFMVKIPSETEQKQIGDFFKQLDFLITLHQRKQNHLKLLKKSLLQQMFM